MTLHKTADIDIDFADRNQALKLIDTVPARQMHQGEVRRHNSGVYVTDIPWDPINQCAAIDYHAAEQRGYFKLDFLNMSVYQGIRDPEHYEQLLATTPPWTRLKEREFVEQLVHINNHYSTLHEMPEPVDSIPRMAMFLAVIRPGKKHLIGLAWKEVAETIWDATEDGYSFKKAHAVSYAVLVTLHMNLLNTANQGN
jgi:hypothetical protein